MNRRTFMKRLGLGALATPFLGALVPKKQGDSFKLVKPDFLINGEPHTGISTKWTSEPLKIIDVRQVPTSEHEKHFLVIAEHMDRHIAALTKQRPSSKGTKLRRSR